MTCRWLPTLLGLALQAAPALAQAPKNLDTIDMREAFAPPAGAPASAAASAPAERIGSTVSGPRPRLVRVEPPRDTAHHLGDVLLYRALISWPEGWVVDRDGLPDTSGAERPIELRAHTIEPARADDCLDCRWLTLHWQLFKGPRASEDQRLAATPVRLRRGADVVTLELPPAVIAVSPLVPWDSRRNWLNSVRPGWRALPFDTHARFAEAGLALGLALLALTVWGWASGRFVVGAERRPFAHAWRAVRSRKLDATAQADADDLRLWHRAFDATAGEALFIENLDAFFAARPALAPLAGAAHGVFEASRQSFFLEAGASSAARVTRGDLIDLLGRFVQAEFTAGKAAKQPATGSVRA